MKLTARLRKELQNKEHKGISALSQQARTFLRSSGGLIEQYHVSNKKWQAPWCFPEQSIWGIYRIKPNTKRAMK